VSSEEFAGILRTTPNLQSLRLEFNAGERGVMAFSDALKHARKGGVPLLEHLYLAPAYEWGHGGMDWQVRWTPTARRARPLAAAPLRETLPRNSSPPHAFAHHATSSTPLT